MISAPLRTPHLEESPSVKTHGHLALLEWDEMLPSTPPTPFPKPVRKSVIGRCYDSGTALLFVITVAALVASLCRF